MNSTTDLDFSTITVAQVLDALNQIGHTPLDLSSLTLKQLFTTTQETGEFPPSDELENRDTFSPPVKPFEVLEAISTLDQQHNTNNYLPIYKLRARFSYLSREELDQILYQLEKEDKIEMGTLAEVRFYTPEQIGAGIPQPIGGCLFYITVL